MASSFKAGLVIVLLVGTNVVGFTQTDVLDTARAICRMAGGAGLVRDTDPRSSSRQTTGNTIAATGIRWRRLFLQRQSISKTRLHFRIYWAEHRSVHQSGSAGKSPRLSNPRGSDHSQWGFRPFIYSTRMEPW